MTGFAGQTKNIGGTSVASWYNVSENAARVLDNTRPPEWVCTFPEDITYEEYTPCVDNTEYTFESKNTLEWGDTVGQNTRDEGVDIVAAGMTYMHLPVGGQMVPPVPFNPAAFLRYAPQFIEAINTAQAAGGHVLFHCTIGYRTGAFPVGLLGVITETDTTPQLTRAEMNSMMHSWGYDVADEQTGHVFEVGTNSMFAGLPGYKFTGSVNWDTGRIDGSIAVRATPEAEPETEPEQVAPPPPPRSSAALAPMPAIVGLAHIVLAMLFA